MNLSIKNRKSKVINIVSAIFNINWEFNSGQDIKTSQYQFNLSFSEEVNFIYNLERINL